MRGKSLLGLTLCASLLIPNQSLSESLVDKTQKKVETITRYAEPDLTYKDSRNIKFESKSVGEDLGRSFNILSYDSSVLDNPFRIIPDSDNIPFFENFINQMGRILETDYGYYLWSPSEIEMSSYESHFERMNHDSHYGVDFTHVLYKSLKEVFQGYDVVEKIGTEVREATSVKVEVDEREVRTGLKFSSNSLIKPYVGIKNPFGFTPNDRLDFSIDASGEFSLAYRIKIGKNKYWGIEFEQNEEEQIISSAFRWRF